jgi:hypothetical protein
MLELGVIRTSRKENEKRVAIHPEHPGRIPEGRTPEELREKIVFETGYGEPFGITDAEIEEQCRAPDTG